MEDAFFALTERRKRFRCPHCGLDWVDIRLVYLVEGIEEEIGERLTVSSGYRCEEYNASKEVGGSKTSSHLRGLAADIDCNLSRLRYRVILAAMKRGIHRIGIGKTYMHMDIDRHKDPQVVWVY